MLPFDYIFKDMNAIEGYIDPLDALVFCALAQFQTAQQHEGSFFEIGVYYGRSFFLLDLLRGATEGLLGADVFLTDQDKFGPGHQKRMILNTARTLGSAVTQDNLLEGDSTALSPSEVLSRVGTCRFVHVDGGHLSKHVKADSTLSADIITPDGIICFDDFFNTDWPEVTTAVLEYLQSQEVLVPFLMTDKKLYACPADAAFSYRSALQHAPSLRKFKRFKKKLLTHPVWVLHHPIGRRIAFEMASKTPLRGLSRQIYV